MKNNNIIIKGAYEHNLKHINLTLPRDKLIVFTGVSGSGKSSLAFDTIYAEGQRRYVESLSSYARQFIGQMEKPHIDFISGLSPAISIEQKATSKNPRSTVGTVTEIYDYLRLLFAHIGIAHCYKCGKPIGSQTIEQMVDEIMKLPENSKIIILAPQIQSRKGEHRDVFDDARKSGFVRVRVNGKIISLDEEINLAKKRKHKIEIVIDRLIIKSDLGNRLSDSLETALKIGDGIVIIHIIDEKRDWLMSEKNACVDCGISYEALTPQMFSFNNPNGMCRECSGLGTHLEVDFDLIIPDKNLSLRQGAIAPWNKRMDNESSWGYKIIEQLAKHYGFSLDTAWKDLTPKYQNILLYGSGDEEINFKWESDKYSVEQHSTTKGIIPNIERLFHQTQSDYMRHWYSRFMRKKTCPACSGKRLRKESLAVKINNNNINQITSFSIREALNLFNTLELTEREQLIADEVLKEIIERLSFLDNVGLHYLSLDRSAPTLSGGEAQRIRLASQIGSGLVGVLYILDEPSIGLHQRDNARLLSTLLHLRDMGNTLIVVEHDEETIRRADYIVDFGPEAGINGGEIVIADTPKNIMKHSTSLTGKYLSGRLHIPTPSKRRESNGKWLELKGATHNNLKSIDVKFPLGMFICVTGVSGSGKSSLVNETLYPILARKLNRAYSLEAGNYKEIKGLQHLDKVIDIDQNPIGRTPRSNPSTYVKVFDHIRKIFSQIPEAKIRGYKQGRFSFNVKGGRCEACSGAGVNKIEMHFLSDVYVPCEVCKGKRYNRDTLEIRYKGKNISDVLDLDVQEALELFANIPPIKNILETLYDVGLDYIKLGQPATTLSGGEAQRVKLARELCKRSTGRTLYILDEPTTGLHYHDVNKLLKVLNRLTDNGNTVIVIEHNLEVIKTADWIIDLGPEGGDYGGEVVTIGTPEDIANCDESYTGQFLKKILF